MLAWLWHVWIGVILFAVSILAVVGLLGGYVKKVVSPQFPGKRQHED